VSGANLRIHAHFLLEIKHTGALKVNQPAIKSATEDNLSFLPGAAYVHIKTIPSVYKNVLDYLDTEDDRTEQAIKELQKLKVTSDEFDIGSDLEL